MGTLSEHSLCPHIALWAFSIGVYTLWAQSTQFKLCPISLWTSVSPVSYPMVTHMPRGHFHYALWAFPLYPVAIPNEFLCPVGTRNLSFSAKTYPATTCPVRLWAFPTAVICHVGIPNPHSSHCAPYALWSSVCSVGLSPLPPICPVGISHSALWVLPFPYAMWAFPTSSNAPWARATLSFSVKTYPAMTCPVGIPNCCLYALWAFPILIFHIVPHMTCGHQYAPWAYPQGHQYALWAFPILPCGHSHMPMGIPNKRQCPRAFPILPCGHPRSHMPCGHSQPALMSRGPPQRFLFQ